MKFPITTHSGYCSNQCKCKVGIYISFCNSVNNFSIRFLFPSNPVQQIKHIDPVIMIYVYQFRLMSKYYHKNTDAEKLITTTPISTNQTTRPATYLIKKTMTSDMTESYQNTT